MNYIRHLSGFFMRLAEDQRMTPYHISLYFALFQQWNEGRFADQFVISRSEMMQLSRIGSANTYARCIKELADWGYINYIASSNIHSGSRVCCIRFDTANDTASSTGTDTGTKSDTKSDTGTNHLLKIEDSADLKSDTGRSTATDTGLKNDIASDTGKDTASSTGTSGNTGTDTAIDTASDTGITANTENDTGRSTGANENDSAGLKTDTGCDTGTDTLFINNTNSLNKKKRQSEKKPKDDFVEKEKNPERKETENSGNLPDEKFRVPDLPVVEQFFAQNRFPHSEVQKFYAHYQSADWKTGDMKKILSWQAVARKWMNNNHSFKSNERESYQVGTGKLSVTVNKNYNEPL